MRKGREKIKAIDGVMKVERVRCKDGSTARFPTEKQINKYVQVVGTALRDNFYVCRKYLEKGGNILVKQTCCSMLKTLLKKKDPKGLKYRAK